MTLSLVSFTVTVTGKLPGIPAIGNPAIKSAIEAIDCYVPVGGAVGVGVAPWGGTVGPGSPIPGPDSAASAASTLGQLQASRLQSPATVEPAYGFHSMPEGRSRGQRAKVLGTMAGYRISRNHSRVGRRWNAMLANAFRSALPRGVAVAACFLVVPACANSNAASSPPPAAIAAQSSDVPSPPAASTNPAASPSPSPVVTPTPSPLHYVIVPTPAPSVSPASVQEQAPQILEIDLSDRELSAPGPLSVRVITSINVNGVWARVAGRERGIPPTHAGLFEASDQLPSMPFFLKGKAYTVDFVAKTVDGRETVVSVPIFIKR